MSNYTRLGAVRRRRRAGGGGGGGGLDRLLQGDGCGEGGAPQVQRKIDLVPMRTASSNRILAYILTFCPHTVLSVCLALPSHIYQYVCLCALSPVPDTARQSE